MSSLINLSSGSIEEYLCQGRQPPTNKAVFQIITSRPIKDQNNDNKQRIRLCLSDGVHTCTQAMLMLKPESTAPEDNSIIQVIDPFDSQEGQNNALTVVNEKYIWVVYNFKILREGGAQMGDPSPVKLSVNSAGSSLDESTPNQRAKRPTPAQGQAPTKKARNVVDNPNATSVRKALFQDGGPTNQQKPSHLIKDLNPYQNKFKIKARVARKGELRTWSNSRGEGCVFDVTLQDSSGEIKVSGFNDQARKFHQVFEEGKVYWLETATIKAADRRFNTTDHNYELSLHQGSNVQLCHDSKTGDVPGIKYNLKPISEIKEMNEKDSTDAMGVVVSVGDVQDLTTRAGRDTKKREIRIVDNSGQPAAEIMATLWGDQAVKFDEQSLHKVVLFRKASVGEWQGKSLNVGFGSSTFVEPAGSDEAIQLKSWFDGQQDSVLQNLATNPATSPRKVASGTLCTLADIKSLTAGNDSAQTFNVEAFFISFKLDKLMYNACPTETCRRKVVEANGQFRCEKCDKTFPKCDQRYIVQATMADMTDYHFATLFNEAGEEVFGVQAGELKRLENEEHLSFRQIINESKHKLFKLTLRSKIETWNDEKRLKLSVVTAAVVNRADFPTKIGKASSRNFNHGDLSYDFTLLKMQNIYVL